MSRRTLSALFASALLLSGTTRASAASLFDPALKFRVLKTDHFRIYFHQGEDRMAARLAAIAEDSWHALERPLGTRPPPLTHVVLADQTELANGYATPLPFNTIVIFPTWPRSSEFNTDDWLRLVFTHEFTHIVHLDRSEGYARVFRNIFGRTLIAFPNLFLPQWQIEGLATFEESNLTGEGRLHAGDFRVVVDEAARQRGLEPLDRVNGGLTDWPSGNAAYAYGARFHQYLSDRYGQEKLATLAKATARRVPYTASPAFRKVFGESLGDLWRDFESSLEASSGPPARDPAMVQLTHHGFVAAGPRFDPVGGGIVYAKRTPDDFPTLERIADDGTATRVATRYFGATTAIGREALYFDQLEFERSVAVVADLYRLNRATGRVTRLTSSARLRDPDLSPDGSTIVAAQENRGERRLVLVKVDQPGTPEVLAAEADTQFSTPRWSPNGRQIAAERHRLGSDPEIVVVDVATHNLRVIAATPGSRFVMPSWRIDGRAVLAAGARGDEPFNIYEFPAAAIGPGLPIARPAGGAIWPEMSPDGRRLLFVGYTTAGYDLFSIPYPHDFEMWNAAENHGPSATVETPVPALPQAAQTFSPWPTLLPRSWDPEIEWQDDQVRLGAAVFGRDVLGYHAYAASATWLVSSPSGAPTPSRATPDWFASYAYARWQPTLFVSASSETEFFSALATGTATTSPATRRTQQVEGGVVRPFIRARHSHTALATVLHSVDDYTFVDRPAQTRDRTAVRAAWRSLTARNYGYSISAEDGVAFGATAEFVRKSLGSSDDATVLTGDFRAYLPGLRQHHVIAARVAGGGTTGAPIVGRTFFLGGSGPDASVTDFGSSAFSLMRGFEPDSFFGSHVALVNAEYRWPIARPQRGYGTWPLFVHTVHAAAFADIGHAWTRRFDSSDIKTSLGGELSFQTVVGFYFPFTAVAGAAWGHDGSGTFKDGVTAYFRVGRAF